MEKILLSLLFLSGWKSFSCLPRQYHYVPDPMTWTEAQTYCRNTYTDLATVENSEEKDRLISTVSSNSSLVWIGMLSIIGWKWSDGYEGSGADFRSWEKSKEPDFYADQYCVDTGYGGWWDDGCNIKYPFICYNGTSENPEFFLVDEGLDWTSAQSHCRENYKDLATVRNDAENQKVEDLVPAEDWAWIGLYRDPDHAWSDGTVSTYTDWEGSSNPLGNSTVLCIAADMQSGGKWRLKPCDTEYPFVCHTSSSEKQVMKLKFKAEGSVDMNDPAVKAQILKKLQDRLEEDGVSGVTLRWREQPDGKVFHKEETCPQKKNNENFPLCG